MELRQLRYFLQIADLKSFSRAAGHVRIAQPALSRQIRKLEEELGVRLLYRTGRGAVLTEAGEQFYERIKGILRQLEQVQTEIQEAKDKPTGEVALGVPPQLGPVFVAHVVRKFRERYPNAQIRVSEGFSDRIADWLQTGRVDLGFVYHPEAYRHLTAELMVEEDLYLVGPAGDTISGRPTCQFKDIVGLRLITPDLPSSLRVCVENAAAKIGTDLRFYLKVDSIPAIKELVREGEGHAVLPYAAVHDEVKRDLLRASRIVRPSMWRPLGLAAPRKGILSLSTKKLIELTRDEVSSLMAEGAWSGRVMHRTT